MTSTTTTAVIALGGCDHGDDAAALLVADILRRRVSDRVTLVEAPGAEGDLGDVWLRHDTVYLLDTVRTGSRPGKVHRIDPMTDALPPGHGDRSSDLSLRDVISLARTRRGRTHDLVVLGIEGRWFRPESGVSPEVAAAAHRVSEQIIGAVRNGRPASE
jgi:hydrogenase maturation protease